MAYRDFSDFYTPGMPNTPRQWNPQDGDNPHIGTTQLFSRRALYYLEHSQSYIIPYSDRDENYKNGE